MLLYWNKYPEETLVLRKFSNNRSKLKTAPTSAPASSDQKGFNLIELMLVMAIIAILIIIAYPSYQQHGYKTRRADAHVALLESAGQMEKVFGRTRDFTQASIGVVDDKWVIRSTDLSAAGHYKISLQTTRNTYTLFARPVTAGSQLADTQCQLLSINQLGERSANSKADGSGKVTTDICWQQ